MDRVSLQICFGNAKKWMECEGSLIQSCEVDHRYITRFKLTLVIYRKVQNGESVSTSVSQNIPLSDLQRVCSVYHSSQRPHCLQLTRQQGQRLIIAFEGPLLKDDWKAKLSQHLNASTGKDSSQPVAAEVTSRNITEIRDIQAPVPTDKDADSFSETDSEEDDGSLYASIEFYSQPLTMNMQTLPPPLPQRNQLSIAQRRSQAIYDSANDWLQKVHRILAEIEFQKEQTPKKKPEVSAPQVGLLIDLTAEQEQHFDSMPLPSYTGPEKPAYTRVTEYLQPVSQPSKVVEPIYATINKTRQCR